MSPAGIGASICVIACLVSWYYNTIVSWAVYFLFSSFTNSPPWLSCNNTWNTENCTTFRDRILQYTKECTSKVGWCVGQGEGGKQQEGGEGQHQEYLPSKIPPLLSLSLLLFLISSSYVSSLRSALPPPNLPRLLCIHPIHPLYHSPPPPPLFLTIPSSSLISYIYVLFSPHLF